MAAREAGWWGCNKTVDQVVVHEQLAPRTDVDRLNRPGGIFGPGRKLGITRPGSQDNQQNNRQDYAAGRLGPDSSRHGVGSVHQAL